MTTYSLKENNAGGLLLTIRTTDDLYLVYSANPKTMSEYLFDLQEGAGIDYMRDSAWADEVEDDELDIYEKEWAEMPVIADEDGVYADRACVAGSKTLQLAGLRKNALATLDACATAEEVRDLATAHDDIICPNEGYSPELEYRKYNMTWCVCQIVYEKIKPETYEDISAMVELWNDICKALVGAEYIDIDSYDTTGDDFETVPFAEADTIMLTCAGVNLGGIKPYDMSGTMAYYIDGAVLTQTDYERDEDTEWFYFKKREK